MDFDKNYNYEDIENITINVIKILFKNNVSMEDIVYISGKTEEEIRKVINLEG